MKNITTRELYDLYIDTLDKCGIYLLKEEDIVIETNIYEDFDIGIHSFFYIDSLNKLYESGFISLNKLNKSSILRDKVIQLQDSTEWNIENFKRSTKWREIMILCDEIKSMN